MAGAEQMTAPTDTSLALKEALWPERPAGDPPEAFVHHVGTYEIMPIRQARVPSLSGTVLLTNDAGEYLFLSDADFRLFTSGRLRGDSDAFKALRTRHMLRDARTAILEEGRLAQLRTRKHLAGQDPSLHIFVTTLRCDHRCRYCQVTPRHERAVGYDMTRATADAALDHTFSSSAPLLTLEFQGGESALAFETVRYIVERATNLPRRAGQSIRYVLTTTLQRLTDDMLAFCRDYSIELSTSLDGPEDVHNANRPNPSRNSFRQTLEAIDRARRICGPGSVEALATITRHSLPHATRIIDTYAALGFRSIALRPVSPFGLAVRGRSPVGCTVEEYLRLYRMAVEHLIDRNLSGLMMEESYATLLLTKILTPFPTSYVDLQSPAAAGSNVRVYNYDGGVYVSDEARMLAEMGDDRFRMGSVFDLPEQLAGSEALRIIKDAGVAERLPGCSDCVFVPYCGADPVFHVATQGDPIGHRPTSEFCKRHTGQFQFLFELLARRDPRVMRVLLSWIGRRPIADIPVAGYMQ